MGRRKAIPRQPALFAGRCTRCGNPYDVGQLVTRQGDGYIHYNCARSARAEVNRARWGATPRPPAP